MVVIECFSELRKYLQNTDVLKLTFEDSSEKWKTFLKVFFLNLFIGYCLSIITSYIRIVNHVIYKENNFSIYSLWLLNLTIIPVAEELAFRLPLIYSRANISLSILIITFMGLSVSLSINMIDLTSGVFPRVSISLIVAAFFFFVLRNKSINIKASILWEENRKLILYTFLLLFTFRHLDNLIFLNTFYLFPLLLLPQFVSGIFLSFIRVRFGFIFSIIFHVLINFFALLPQLIFYYAC